MSRLLYYLVIYPLSSLPLSILYVFSDIISLFFFLTGYRGKVILDNLRKSFPDKSETEIRAIQKKFYSHFADIWIELLKAFTISDKEIRSRMKFKNPEFLDDYKGKHIIVVMGHYNNWEMVAVGFPQQVSDFAHLCLYTPVKDPFLDKKILESREKYGLRMMSRKKARKELIVDETTPTLTYLVADQSALTSKKVYWVPFLNRESAVFAGPERYSRIYNRPVIFLHTRKLKRGHYEVELSEISKDPDDMLPGEITFKHVKRLEEKIVEKPQYWLWSHKRWKKGKLKENTIKYDLEAIKRKHNYE